MDVKSADINEYVKEAAGGEFSAKDFRTWNGTVLAAVALAVSGAGRAASKSGAQARQDARGEGGGRYLGNTPAVARASYIDPRVFDRFDGGLTIAGVLPTWPRTRPPGRTSRERSRRACSTCSPRTGNRPRSRRAGELAKDLGAVAA